MDRPFSGARGSVVRLRGRCSHRATGFPAQRLLPRIHCLPGYALQSGGQGDSHSCEGQGPERSLDWQNLFRRPATALRTYIGGDGYDGIDTHQMEVDREGNAYASTSTDSTNMPTTAGVLHPVFPGGLMARRSMRARSVHGRTASGNLRHHDQLRAGGRRIGRCRRECLHHRRHAFAGLPGRGRSDPGRGR